MRVRKFVLVAVCLAAACDDSKHRKDGGINDAAVLEDGGVFDASVDAGAGLDGGDGGDAGAPDSEPRTPAHDIIGGAAHVRGIGFSADVQIGHGIGQRPSGGANHVLEGNAAVKP